MKTIIILMLVASFSVQGQSYTVIHSIGKIRDAKTGKYLAKGTRLDESATLKFESEGARAAVLSSSRGRFIIQEAAPSKSNSDLAYTLSSVISPARGRLSTRAGEINNRLDFQKKFGEGPVAIVGDSYQVKVSPSAFPMSQDQFFYIQYQYSNEPVNKKLAFNNAELILDIAELYSVDSVPIDAASTSDTKLLYYDAERQESTMVTAMDLVMVEEEDFRYLANELQNDVQAMLEIINSLYGSCNEEDVVSALNKLK